MSLRQSSRASCRFQSDTALTCVLCCLDVDLKALLEGSKEEANALRLALTAAKERYQELKAMKDGGHFPTPATTPDAASQASTPNAEKLLAELEGTASSIALWASVA
jgi:hypothetical protein